MNTMKSILVTISAGILLFLTLGAWALSSPVGSSPDDDFHLASIWCGQGERDGLCATGSSPDTRLVPDKAVNAACFAFAPTTTASCQGEHYLDEGFSLVETSRVNSGSQYPAGFYFVASFFTNENLSVSTVSVRLFNSALFAALIVGAYALLPPRIRFTLAGSTILTFVPLGLFFTASVNPSSWAFMSGALLLPTLLGWFSTNGWRRWALGGMAVLAALLGVSARGDSGAYLVVGSLAATVLAFQHNRRFWLRMILPVLLLIVGAFAFLSSGQTSLALGGEMGGSAGAENTTSKAALAVINLLSLPNLWGGIYGQGWNLGWLDTSMSAIVPGVLVFLAAGTLFAAFRVVQWRRGIALAGIGLAAVVVPTYILVQSYALVGQEVQPRYILPLITMFFAAALAPSAQNDDARWHPGLALSRLQIWMVAVGVTGTQAIALFENLRRYVTTGSYNLNGAQDWWWTTGPSPFATLGVGVLACAVLMLIFALATVRDSKAAQSLQHTVHSTGFTASTAE